jgi:ankyrin repeat protein
MNNNFNHAAAPATYTRPEKFALLDKLVVALEKGDVPAVEDLLQRGADIACIGHGIANGFTALCWAVCRGWPELVQVLVENGAAVDGKDQWGFTPLMRAVLDDSRFDIARFLLEKGAALEEKSSTRKTALDYAVERKNSRTEALLRETVKTRWNTSAEGLHATASARQEWLRGIARKRRVRPV